MSFGILRFKETLSNNYALNQWFANFFRLLSPSTIFNFPNDPLSYSPILPGSRKFHNIVFHSLTFSTCRNNRNLQKADACFHVHDQMLPHPFLLLNRYLLSTSHTGLLAFVATNALALDQKQSAISNSRECAHTTFIHRWSPFYFFKFTNCICNTTDFNVITFTNRPTRAWNFLQIEKSFKEGLPVSPFRFKPKKTNTKQIKQKHQERQHGQVKGVDKL